MGSAEVDAPRLATTPDADPNSPTTVASKSVSSDNTAANSSVELP
jgi:hypothetical protein